MSPDITLDFEDIQRTVAAASTAQLQVASTYCIGGTTSLRQRRRCASAAPCDECRRLGRAASRSR